MKKKLSILLVVALLASLLPATVFAATTARSSSVPSITETHTWKPSISSTTTIGNVDYNTINAWIDLARNEVPKAVIKTTDPIEGGKSFAITLGNAEWDFPAGVASNPAGTIVYETATKTLTVTSGSDLVGAEDFSGPKGTMTGYTLERLTATYAIVTLEPGTSLSKDGCIFIPLVTKAKGAGDLTFSISAINANVSSASGVVYAVAGAGSTKATVNTAPKFPDVLPLDSFMIEEIKPNVFNDRTPLRLKAPANFEWVLGGTETVTGTGGLNNVDGVFYYSTYNNGDEDKQTLLVDLRDLTNPVQIGTDAQGNPIYSTKLRTGRTERGILVFANLKLRATDDAKFGDVNLSISGAGSTSESLKIGEYVEYGVSWTAEDKEIPQLISGLFPNDYQAEEIRTLKGIFKEDVVKSWASNRKTTFAAPEGVKFRAVEITKASNVSYLLDPSNDTSKTYLGLDVIQNEDISASTYPNKNILVEDSKVTFNNFDVDKDKKAEIQMRFFVSIEAGYEGDIAITMGGQGVEEESGIVLATAIGPISIDTKSTNLDIGYKNVPIGEITITENIAGGIRKAGTDSHGDGDNSLVLFLEDGLSFTKGTDTKDLNSKFEVLEGDITIESCKVIGGQIQIVVKSESTKPSKIRIYDNHVTLTRDLPVGAYELRVGGVSIIANYCANSKLHPATFDTEYYVGLPNYINIVTAPPKLGEGTFTTVVSVTVGSKELKVGDETVTMDTEAYIDEAGRLMVPVSAVAQALGIAAQNVIWDAVNKTVTIIMGNRVVQFKIGSEILDLGGGVEVTMPTAAVIKDGRSFLPFRVLGEYLLNVTVSWEEATRTATYNG